MVAGCGPDHEAEAATENSRPAAKHGARIDSLMCNSSGPFLLASNSIICAVTERAATQPTLNP